MFWEEGKGGIYPWAQCYGGWQFGSWAGQLGDGRAISLFESTNPETKRRYEIQLKGAGRTPYSRFADGKAVLRSSIREYVVSEGLNALNIPRQLEPFPSPFYLNPACIARRPSLVLLLPGSLRRGYESVPSISLRARADRGLIRKIATYVAEEVLGGWEALPSIVAGNEKGSRAILNPSRGVSSETLQGTEGAEENRFSRLYREIARRNAKTVAAWQAYAFTNGVLNTDNTSIMGLSIDFRTVRVPR